MTMEFVHVGFGNILAASRIVALLSPNQQPARRLIREAKNKGLLIDFTHARKIKAVIILDTGHIAVTAVSPETVTGRITMGREGLVSKTEGGGGAE